MEDFFPTRPSSTPTIYAFSVNDPAHAGLLKVGYTEHDAAQRIAQQFPGGFKGYTTHLVEPAQRADGSAFTDHDVHRRLKSLGYANTTNEWFRCTVEDVKAAILAVRYNDVDLVDRTADFAMRPEQEEAVARAAAYFREAATEQAGHTPHFLWNAKMRFGKTFATYQLAKRMGWKKVLVVTFKPAVLGAWKEDLESHVDFDGWQFQHKKSERSWSELDDDAPLVYFASFQDLLGRTKTKEVKEHNVWVHAQHWDAVVLDEYHFGAWRENAKGLFGGDEEEAGEVADELKGEQGFDTDELPITTDHYLYLSGTPFRAIGTGEFIEEQIYNWTYSDEQRAKRAWDPAAHGGRPNPYAALPRLVLMTYTLPDDIRQVAERGEFNEFDLNEFFRAKGEGEDAVFEHADEVQKWLDFVRGGFKGTTVDDLKMGRQKPPLPFGDGSLAGLLTHSFWFLPDVASCHAMKNLLGKRNNTFWHDFTAHVAAGAAAGIGAEALPPVLAAIGGGPNGTGDPLKHKSITLSCGKLTTGVTVRPWSGLLMLRKCSSPETYFQAAFRVQSPWTVPKEGGGTEIVKPECYVFDFAPNRALRQIADYGSRLATDADKTPEERVGELTGFLPVLAYDGTAMKRLNAEEILDQVTAGTSASLLARKWESVLLVNVDDGTLNKLMRDPKAMEALMSIEGFRNLNTDLETIINRSEQIKDAKKKLKDGGNMQVKEKKELTEAEKERKSLRKKVQEKLIKFAARVPVFMYLTDYREQSLKDVITRIEPALFRKVTGLTTDDFGHLVTLGVFNDALMNDAVYKFRRYEDASLRYMGASTAKHRPTEIGLWDTTEVIEEDFVGDMQGFRAGEE